MTVKEILDTYEEIILGDEIIDGVIFFTIFEKKFLFLAPPEEDPTSEPTIYLFNDTSKQLLSSLEALRGEWW